MALIDDLAKLIRGGGAFEKVQLVATLIGAVVAVSLSFYQEHQKKKLKEASQTYERQLETLAGVQRSIDNLRDFVAAQRAQLQEQQAVLQGLKEEKEKLQPVVEANKEVVEALFRIQAERNSQGVWLERIIGFALGVVSSLVASLIWSAVRLRRIRRGPPP